MFIQEKLNPNMHWMLNISMVEIPEKIKQLDLAARRSLLPKKTLDP